MPLVSVPSAGRRSSFVRVALVALLPLGLIHCGSDNNNDGASQVAAACDGACNATIGTCNLPPGTLQSCQSGCQLGYTIAPSCASAYAAYTDCAKQQPLVSCSGNSVTVTASVPPCFDQLDSYLCCAVGHISICLALPLDDAGCTDASRPHANACVGNQPTCQLFAGAMADTAGAGIYCCP